MNFKVSADYGNSCVWLSIDSASFQLSIGQAEKLKNMLEQQLFYYSQADEMCELANKTMELKMNYKEILQKEII